MGLATVVFWLLALTIALILHILKDNRRERESRTER